LPPLLIDRLPIDKLHSIMGKYFESLVRYFSQDDEDDDDTVESPPAEAECVIPKTLEESPSDETGGGGIDLLLQQPEQPEQQADSTTQESSNDDSEVRASTGDNHEAEVETSERGYNRLTSLFSELPSIDTEPGQMSNKDVCLSVIQRVATSATWSQFTLDINGSDLLSNAWIRFYVNSRSSWRS
jgi:hypothetical protein